MSADETEARRLAAQRQQDLREITDRELDHARAQGRKDAEELIFRQNTKEHFAVINGSIERTANELRTVRERLTTIEGAMATDEAIEKALTTVADRSGAKRFTRLQSFGITIMSFVAFTTFILSIVTVLGK